MHYQTGEAWLRRQLTREAIDLAMQGRWEETIATNKDIIEIFPKDVSAYNRVGKSLAELGWYTEAKEAYTKARGDGLSLPLKQFDVSLAPREPAALLSTKGDSLETARWALRALDPGPEYAAALAVEGHGWQLKCWQWLE